MIKLLFVLFLIFSVLEAQTPCSTLSCSNEGEKCTSDYYYAYPYQPGTIDNDDQIVFCNSGFYCNRLDLSKNLGFGICSKVGEEGDQCPVTYDCSNVDQDCPMTITSNTGCGLGLSCYGGGNGPTTCQYLNYLTLGEDCESDLQCVLGLRCDTMETETCVVNINQTVAETIICEQSTQCKANEYCDTTGDSNVCSPLKSDGQSCGSTNECQPTSVCELAQCKKIYGSGENADCDVDVSSLVCDISQNLICLNSKCTVVPSPESGNCSDASVACSDFETCICTDGLTGACKSTYFSSTPAQCKTSVTTFLQCQADNACPNSNSNDNLSSYYAPGSCGYKNCGQYLCDVISNCGPSNINQCNTDPLLASVCTSNSSMIQISILVIILSLFSILF